MNNKNSLKNLQCDICSKQVLHKFQLNTLREIYQTEGTVQICDDCGDRLASKILKEISEYMGKIEEPKVENKPKYAGVWSKVWLKLFERR